MQITKVNYKQKLLEWVCLEFQVLLKKELESFILLLQNNKSITQIIEPKSEHSFHSSVSLSQAIKRITITSLKLTLQKIHLEFHLLSTLATWVKLETTDFRNISSLFIELKQISQTGISINTILNVNKYQNLFSKIKKYSIKWEEYTIMQTLTDSNLEHQATA